MSAVQFRCQEYVFELTGHRPLVELLEALFFDLVTAPIGEPHCWDVERFEGYARVVIDGSDVGEWARYPDFPAAVISKLTMTVIAAQPAQLHLHAGAVVADGATILLLAPSGSGKSTLTCALVAAGAHYRTDEVVAVDRDGRRVSTYPKPVSVKASGIEVAAGLTGLTCPPGADNWEFPVSSFGTLAIGDGGPVKTLVFNAYLPSQPVLVEPVHRATAVRTMLADSQDAVLFGPDSLVAAAHLAASAQCVRVTGGDAPEMVRAVREVHRGAVEPGALWTVPPVATNATLARAPGVRSVVIDERAVLFTADPAHVVELDEDQTVWWLLLDGTPFDQIVDDVVEATGASRDDVVTAGSTFIEGFRELEVLDGH